MKKKKYLAIFYYRSTQELGWIQIINSNRLKLHKYQRYNLDLLIEVMYYLKDEMLEHRIVDHSKAVNILLKGAPVFIKDFMYLLALSTIQFKL